MRKFIAIVTLLYLAAVAGALAFLSHGFSEDISFEGSVVIAPLAISGLVVLIVAVFAFWQRSRSLTTVLVAVAIGSIVYIGNVHHDAFGAWFPSLTPETAIESSGVATLNAHGQTVRYRLELHNAGEVNHREFLFVARGGREQRIRLPLLDDAGSGFVSAKKPNDWIVLLPTNDADIYDAKSGRLMLAQKSFRVNVRTGQVTVKSNPAAALSSTENEVPRIRR
jgi:hypothetical protein